MHQNGATEQLDVAGLSLRGIAGGTRLSRIAVWRSNKQAGVAERGLGGLGLQRGNLDVDELEPGRGMVSMTIRRRASGGNLNPVAADQ